MQNPEDTHISEILEHLPSKLRESQIVCPLCNSSAPASGLRVKTRPGTGEEQWFVVFTCPACGVISEFDVKNINLKHLESGETSLWGIALRNYEEITQHEEQIHAKLVARPSQMIAIAIFSMLTWIILTGSFDLVNLVWGLAVSLIVARLSYRAAALKIKLSVFLPSRWLHLLALAIEFVRQLIIQNVTLSIRVLRPDLPIKPGIIAVPTSLESDFELSLMGSLLSLTPDTVTVDIDQKEKIIYLHWINVKTTDSMEAKKMIASKLENHIIGWLHGKEGLS